jgi:hypothetical protein
MGMVAIPSINSAPILPQIDPGIKLQSGITQLPTENQAREFPEDKSDRFVGSNRSSCSFKWFSIATIKRIY